MEASDGQMAEINLKTLFVTCKSQWNGDLSKHKEAETTLKATQSALQALLQQVSVRYKENDKQMKKLQAQLSDVAAHLSKPSDEQRTSEETGNLLQTYNRLLAESKISAKKTTDQLMTFGSVRNAVVSMEIKTSDGEKLAAPLFDSALLNFPSEGSDAHETNLLTSLSFLILSSTQKEQWKTPAVAAAKPDTITSSESTEKVAKTKKQIKAEAAAAEGSNAIKPEESKSKATPEGRAKKSADGKEAEFKKPMDHAAKGGKGPGPRKPHEHQAGYRPHEHQGNRPQHNQHMDNKFNKGMADGSKSSDSRKPFHNNVHTPRKVGDFIPHQHRPAFHNVPTSPPILPPPNVYHAPAPPPQMLPQSYCTPPPAVLPSLMSLHNKKAFLVLAVNGKQYGKIVIELRPDVAPIMCQRFAQNCMSAEGDSYRGTVIYQSKPKTFIMGGRIPGPESLYMADPSPLKKIRGSIFFRLKRDYAKTQCSIVSTDFTIHLDDEKADNYRTSTVFGYICDGLAVCDAISHMDCEKDHVAVCSVGIE